MAAGRWQDKEQLRGGGVLGSFLQGGDSFPVLVLTSSRAGLLQRTLSALFALRGVRRQQVLVAQDGSNEEVTAVLARWGGQQGGLRVVRGNSALRLMRQGLMVEGASKIATVSRSHAAASNVLLFGMCV